MFRHSSNGEVNTAEVDSAKMCPLCYSPIRFFHINFKESFLMCENISCEYPFGYEDLQFKYDPVIYSERVASTLATPNNELTAPSTSIASLPIVDNANKLYNSAKSQVLMDIAGKRLNTQGKIEAREHIMNDKEIQKNVKDLKSLTMELKEMDDDTQEIETIKNEKWIKKLMTLQGLSGVKLVKKEEMESLKRDKPAFGGGELKIDIDTNRYNVSSINVQILNKDDA